MPRPLIAMLKLIFVRLIFDLDQRRAHRLYGAGQISNHAIKYLTRISLLTDLVCRHLADSASDSAILGTLSNALNDQMIASPSCDCVVPFITGRLYRSLEDSTSVRRDSSGDWRV